MLLLTTEWCPVHERTCEAQLNVLIMIKIKVNRYYFDSVFLQIVEPVLICLLSRFFTWLKKQVLGSRIGKTDVCSVFLSTVHSFSDFCSAG